MDDPSIGRRKTAHDAAQRIQESAGRRKAATGAPHEATAQCGGGASSGAEGSHAAPCGIDPGVCVPANTEEGVQPEKPHRLLSRSARPVSGRSLLGGVQPVSRLPGKQGSAWWQVRSRGTPTQLLRSEVVSVWRGRDYSGFGAIGSGKRTGPASGSVEDVQSPTEQSRRILNQQPEP